ncbi:MAG: ABC transporter permease subunit [Streptosporangiales bacterium]|nr:ABC transporter permease subunit [Streptosporangiales bacterium]
MSFRYRMLLPLVALFLAVVGYPLVNSFYLSLTDYKITDRANLSVVGGRQYVDALTDQGFWGAFGNTAVFVLVAVTVELVVGLALALALQRQRRLRNLTRGLLLAPMFVTPIAVGLLFRFLLNSQLGVVPAVLGSLGVSYDFFGSGKALLTIALIDAWQWTPFMVLLLLAGLESLPSAPFEAARVDGASAWYTFRRVTLPMLRPVVAVAVLIRGLDALKVFEYVYATTRGGPGTETQTLQYYVYQTGIQFFRMGEASAMGYLVLAVVLVAVIVLFLRIDRQRAA